MELFSFSINTHTYETTVVIHTCVFPYNCRSVVDTIDDNTVLFVIGDHGMTSTGKLDYHFY